MNKLILILCLHAPASSIAISADDIRTEVRCIEGYKFLYSWMSSRRSYLNVTQIMKISIYGAVPMKYKK